MKINFATITFLVWIIGVSCDWRSYIWNFLGWFPDYKFEVELNARILDQDEVLGQAIVFNETMLFTTLLVVREIMQKITNQHGNNTKMGIRYYNLEGAEAKVIHHVDLIELKVSTINGAICAIQFSGSIAQLHTAKVYTDEDRNFTTGFINEPSRYRILQFFGFKTKLSLRKRNTPFGCDSFSDGNALPFIAKILCYVSIFNRGDRDENSMYFALTSSQYVIGLGFKGKRIVDNEYRMIFAQLWLNIFTSEPSLVLWNKQNP